MSNSLQHLTLIIPTYNRPQYLARLLNYYAAKKTQINFLILDSSHNAETLALNEQAVKVLGSHGQYHAFPSTTPFAAKLHDGLKWVKTPFCAFCADDDLVFVDSLAQALAHLEKHPHYVCVDGIYINFNEVGHDIHVNVEYASNGISADEPGARIFRLYQKYESLFYGVFRTAHALAIFAGVNKNPSLHYQELFQATAALFLGKSHRLPIFYAARQNCQPADQQRDKWQTYYWFAENPNEFLQHYASYRDNLWQFYQHHVPDQKYQQTEFFQMMDLIHAMYFSVGCPAEYFHTVLQAYWPSHSFQKPHHFKDNICNQLKSSQRIWLENYVDRLSGWMQRKIAFLYSQRDTKSLNKTVREKTKTNWNCHLSPELKWLSSVAAFRTHYHELCLYIES